MANPRPPLAPEPTRWTIHGERLVDETRRLRLSIAQVELPDGVRYEEPAVTAAREVEEETGWRPHSMTLLTRFQPLVGTADFENLLFRGDGAEDTGKPADANEAARVEWIALVCSSSIRTAGSARNGARRRNKSARSALAAPTARHG